MRQRDKSKMPPIILTYKYFLPQYSFSTLPFSIPKLIFSDGDLNEKLNTSNNAKLPYSKTLNSKSSNLWSSPYWKKWLSTSLFLRLIHSHLLFPFYCSSLHSCEFIHLALSSYFFCSFDPQTLGFE